jgi:hypothetical protein
MANAFLYAYMGNDGETEYPIRLKSDFVAAQPTAPARLETTDQPQVSAYSGARTHSIRARFYRLKREVGSAPNIKVLYSRLPVLNPADVPTLDEAGTVTIGGVTWDVGEYVAQRRGK